VVVVVVVVVVVQWRRQRSKEARSFFSRCPQNTKAANVAEIVSLLK